jgi:hypothetical protein
MDKLPQIRISKAYSFLRREMVFFWDSGCKESIMDLAIINIQKGFSMKVILFRERCMGLVA